MNAASSDIRYIEPVLKRLAHKYAGIGLAIAVFFHFMFVGAFWTAEYFNRSHGKPMNILIPIGVYLPPPPSLADQDALAKIVVSSNPEKGTPIPVPDALVSVEKTIPMQGELDRLDARLNGSLNGGSGVVSGIFKVPNEVAPPDTFRAIEEYPQVVKSVNPQYPELAVRSGIQGRVVVKLWVDKEGKPHDARILESSEEILNKSAIDAAMATRFSPAIMNRGPVSVWITIPFVFKLRQGL